MMAPSWPWGNSRPPVVSISDLVAEVVASTDENPAGCAERIIALAELNKCAVYHGWRGRTCISQQDADLLLGQRVAAKAAADAAEALRAAARSAEQEAVLRHGGLLLQMDTPRTRPALVAQAQAKLAADNRR